MTDMTITACAPLPGLGLVARRGDLVVVTDGRAQGPDPLLGALDEVAAEDGAALVLAAARATLAHPGQFSGACAGVTASGEVAVLVHGAGVATVSIDGAPEVEVRASGALLPVDRTFAGSVVTVQLLSGGQVSPDDRLRLDGGVVYGGGLEFTVASVAASAGAGAGAVTDAEAGSDALADSEPGLPAAALPSALTEGMSAPGDGGAPAAEPGHLPEDEPPAMPEPVLPFQDGAFQDDVFHDGHQDSGFHDHGYSGSPYPGDAPQAGPAPSFEPAAGMPPSDLDLGRAPTMPPFDIPAASVPEAEQSSGVSWWFTEGQDMASGPGDEWRPPTIVVPDNGASLGRQPHLHEPDPASDFEYVSFLGPGEGAGGGPGLDEHGHPGHEVAVEPDPSGLEAPVGADLYVADPALVDGVLCARNHFNDPNVQYCRQCGIAMVQQTQRIQKGPRPPLGVLLLDDGTGFTLDKDYVVGREPVLDGDVAAGRARPLRIPDPGGTVSRLHLRISLIGWQVEVRDLNSSNGSVLQLPNGADQRLLPGDSMIIAPGTKIVIGHRNLQYQSYRAG